MFRSLLLRLRMRAARPLDAPAAVDGDGGLGGGEDLLGLLLWLLLLLVLLGFGGAAGASLFGGQGLRLFCGICLDGFLGVDVELALYLLPLLLFPLISDTSLYATGRHHHPLLIIIRQVLGILLLPRIHNVLIKLRRLFP